MERSFLKKKNILLGLVFFFIFALLSFSYWAPAGIIPNISLVFIIIISFFIRDFYDFIIFLLVGILWVKYSSFISVEYVVMFFLGLASFFFFKFLILKKNFIVPIVSLFIFQILFWIFLDSYKLIFSLSFILEFLYNGVVLGLFFVLGLWLEKKFY